jgi:two-component system, cell cycle sensor histidine kinase and response regulator CckA
MGQPQGAGELGGDVSAAGVARCERIVLYIRRMAATGSALRVLLVDDEPALRGYMKAILQKHGCAVAEAEDGIDALRVIQEQNGKFDLLVTDVRMPKMDGPSLAEHVRHRFPGIPVLFVSAYPAEAPAIARSDLLPKPFPPHALITRVQELSNQR